MSWLPDIDDLSRPPSLEQDEELEEEAPPSHEEIFFSQFRNRPDTTSHHSSFAVSVCRWMDGIHYPGKHCSCFGIADEEGMRVNPRWTAQMC